MTREQGVNRGQSISILIPFHCPRESNQRARNWQWLERYWRCNLPEAQIVMGEDASSVHNPSVPFSKSVAVNDAASRATGDIFVIVDADGYISTDAVLLCAQRIRRAREKGERLWFVPYRQFYRLTKEASRLVLESNPNEPYKFPTPPNSHHVQNDSGSRFGHWWGAGIQIVPREAFEEIGGWDTRFRGWGGEDHAAMQATDTLYWKHKTLPGQHLHIWHPMLSPRGEESKEDETGWVDWKYRVWENQESSGANEYLSKVYYGANGNTNKMRKIVEEGNKFQIKLDKKKVPWYTRLVKWLFN